MTFYTPGNQFDLEKLQNLIKQKKDIKKLHLNRKIEKETLNKGLAEIYAPITKNQQEQTKIINQGQKDQLQAIQNQTKEIKALTSSPSTSALPEKIISAIESQSEDEFHDVDTKLIDSVFQTAVNGLLNQNNTSPNHKFTSETIIKYKINNKPFRIIDNKLFFNEREYEITPLFFNLFIKGNKQDYTKLSDDETTALPLFIDYIGGLGKDKRSTLYKVYNNWPNPNLLNTQGQGISYVFLSSDPNILVNRLEILIAEYLAGNKKQY